MNSASQLSILRNKQLAFDESIQMLKQAKVELMQSGRAVDAWGKIGVLASLTLIPLNCIVNSFQMKTAKSIYQIFAHQLYGEFGKSGARLDGHAKKTFSLLKQAITAELKRKALTEYIPGVNILVGLAEDSVAALQMLQMTDTANKELGLLMVGLDRKISAATQQLQKLGIAHNAILEHLQRSMRTV